MIAHLHIVLAASRGWGWGWWWWWIILAIIFWLLLIPPFGYGRRWYGNYRTRYGGTGMPGATDELGRWQLIEAHFTSEPAQTVLEADDFVGRALSARGIRPDTVEAYRHGHEVAAKVRNGGAGSDELLSAMVWYRSAFGKAV